MNNTSPGAAKTKREVHVPAEMVRNVRMSFYVYKGWKSEFNCPTCQRQTMQHLNFLGRRRSLICDGLKITKVARRGSL